MTLRLVRSVAAKSSSNVALGNKLQEIARADPLWVKQLEKTFVDPKYALVTEKKAS